MLFANRKNLHVVKTTLLYFLVALIVIGCSKDPVNGLEEATSQTSQNFPDQVITEVANPAVPGLKSEVYYAGNKIPVENFNGKYVYQGDIMLSNSMVSSQPVKLVYEKGETPPAQKSVGRTADRWRNNTVFYAIDSDLDEKSRVYAAIKHWESNTNVVFVERSSQSNYIYFVNGSGCSSYVGMIGGKQEITLSDGCSVGNTIHEVGHALGLWHEQMRVDRDSYITVNYANIEDGRKFIFESYAEQGFDGAEFTNSLDFNSIMLYGSYAFSKNGGPTMVKKDGSTYRAQRDALSSGDITGINKMYPSGGEDEKPSYENDHFYTIGGVTVLRYRDRWYFSTFYGWKIVERRDGHWWYV